MTAAQEPLEPRESVEPVESVDEPAGFDEPEEPVDPDEVAEQAPIDPTPQEVDEYRALIGDETPERTAGTGGRVPEIPEF